MNEPGGTFQPEVYAILSPVKQQFDVDHLDHTVVFLRLPRHQL